MNKKDKKLKHIIDPDTGVWKNEFKANGKKYYIRTPDEGLSLFRYSVLKQRMVEVGFDGSFVNVLGQVDQVKGYANTLVTKQPRLDLLFSSLENMSQSLKKANRNWHYSYMAATLFIVTEDEDISEWTERDAEKKIEDWNKEGFHHLDFFLLVMYWVSSSTQKLNESWQKIQQIIEAVNQSLDL